MKTALAALMLLVSYPALGDSPNKAGVSEAKDLGEDYKQLLQLMPKVADALRPKDPQTADRVMAAYAKAMENRTESTIDEVIQELGSGHPFEAKERQERVSKNFKALMDLLTGADKKDYAKEIQQLEDARKALEALKEREKALLDKTSPQAAREALSAALGKALADLEAMIAAQKGMTGNADAGKPQADLAEQAKSLADRLKTEMGNSEAAKQEKMDEALKAAGRSTESASQDMKSAAGALGEPGGQKPDAGKAKPGQESAGKKLEEARQVLAEKKRRLDEQLEKGSIKDLKDAQEKLKEDTEKTAEEMKKPENPAASAAAKAQSASQSMGKASSSMSGDKAAEAQKDEQQAIDELQKAVDDVKKKQDDARDQQKKQDLYKLAEELKKMLETQKAVHAATGDLEKALKAAPLGRPEQIKMAKASTDQRALAGAVGPVIEKLDQEDAEVFSWALKGVQEDMGTIAGRLEKQVVDAFTQEMQGEVEATLEKLIEALKDEAKKPGGGGGGGGGGGSKKPLVPPAAQLKFLKRLQAEVKEKTVKVDKDRYTDGEYERLSEAERARVDRVAQEQGRVAGITKEWADKLAKGQ